MMDMSNMTIGVDPHKASKTISVLDPTGAVALQARFPNTHRGFRDMLRAVALLHGLTFHYLFEEVHDVPLPFSIEFVADNRTISVDGHALVFDGVRISSSTRWIGSARLPGATLQVTVAAAVPDFELVSSNDVDLPELPSR